jgi:hypothetical protein
LIETKPVSLFFAFADGVFHHVCAECNALCCRGQGFGGSLQREMKFLLKQYPVLQTMTVSRQRDIVSVSTPAGRCFFLGDDNLCQIEKDHGKAQKPGVCTIFPFNRFGRIGDTVVITPHFLCPLRIQVPPRPGEVEGTHAFIEKNLRESAMLESKYVEWYLPQGKLSRGETPRNILERERTVRDDYTEGLGRERFFDVVCTHYGDAKGLKAFRKRAARLMGWPTLPEPVRRDAIDDILLAIAPKLRVDWIHRPDDDLNKILALSEWLIRTALPVSAASFTPQAVHELIQGSSSILLTLAFSDTALAISGGCKSAPFGTPELVFATFIAKRDAGTMGVLRALEGAFKHIKSTSDRAALVHELAKDIQGPKAD